MRKVYGVAGVLAVIVLMLFIVEAQLARFRHRLTTALPGMIYAAILKERSYG